MKTYITGYKTYKPTKGFTGGAIQLNPAEDLSCIFLEIAPQIKGNAGDDIKAFDWENKIVFKLGENDMLSLISVFESVRDFNYKMTLLGDPATFDAMQQAAASANKGNLLSLFHSDQNKGTTSTLNVKPNSAQYGGGFLVQVTKQYTKENTVSHRINISPVEAHGILYCLEKCIFNRI